MTADTLVPSRVGGSCPECGFRWDRPPSVAAVIIGGAPARVSASLDGTEDLVRRRRDPQTWSMLEYAAHLADALDWYADRLERIRSQDRPRFSPFDWDAACEQRRYN